MAPEMTGKEIECSSYPSLGEKQSGMALPLAAAAAEAGDDTDVAAMDLEAGGSGLRSEVSFRRLLAAGSGGDAASLAMQWTDLSFSVGKTEILKGVTGTIEPGRLTAVLGPSGSGKTTLMNLLAGRQRTTGEAGEAPMRGSVSVAGAVVRPVDFKAQVAYVMQDDRLMSTETPRECIQFSAYLRGGGTAQQRAEFVEMMVDTLGLERCADTIVGSTLLKGISGGEKKRVSVAVELITGPKLLFLDEPLSGLDSYAAFTVTQMLKELASAGVPVLCTIHQPSSEIFAMFDDVVILHEGSIVYHGPVAKLASYFARWARCPPNFNPADHVLFLLQRQGRDQHARIQEMKRAWLESELYQSMRRRIDDARAHPDPIVPGLSGNRGLRRPGRWAQLAVLIHREIRGNLRNKGILIARFGLAFFLAAIYTWLYAGSASNPDSASVEKNCTPENYDVSGCASANQAHFSVLCSLSMASMMAAAQPVLHVFPSERPVFLREYAARNYSVVPYFISKTLVEMPIVMVGELISYSTAYWITGLNGPILQLMCIAWALGVTSSSQTLMLSCGVTSVTKAMQLAPVVQVPQMLFSGLFLPVSQIPASLQWVKYLCPLKYAINLATITEFSYIKDRVEACEAQQSASLCQQQHPGDYLRIGLLEKQGVHFEEWAEDVTALVALFIVFRLLSIYFLWRRGKYVF